jgi:hypothetical protein
MGVGDEPLNAPDGQGAFEVAPSALPFARGVSGPTQAARQGGILHDELVRFFVAAATDERDVAVGLESRPGS